MGLEHLCDDEGRSHTYLAGRWSRRERCQNPVMMGMFESIGKFERTAVRHKLNELVFVIRTALSPMYATAHRLDEEGNDILGNR
jgi:hypothetical protein